MTKQKTIILEDSIIKIGNKSIEVKKDHRDLTADIYEVPKEYRADGFFVGYSASGEAKEIPACRTYTFIGSVDIPANEEAILENTKQAKINLLNTQYEKCTEFLESTYPESERASWSIQSQEAALVLKDPESITPWLDAAALARGVSRAEMAVLISDMDIAYRTTHGKLTGARQSIRGQILAAETLEELSEVQTQIEV